MTPAPAGLVISLWLTLTLAAIAPAAAAGRADSLAVALLFWGALFAFGLNAARRARRPERARQLVNVVALIGLASFLLQLLGGEGALRAALALLLWMQAARNFTFAARRDAYFALAISFVLVVYGAAEARSTAFVLLLAGYSIAALATLVCCHQWRYATDAALASPAPLPRSQLLLLCAGVLALAALWYLLVPRPPALGYGLVPLQGGPTYGNAQWEREARRGGASTERASDDADLEDATPQDRHAQPGKGPAADALDITRSQQGAGGTGGNAIVLYVNADRMLYLRTKTFDRFDGRRWERTDSRSLKLLPRRGAFPLDEERAADQPGVQYQVHVVARVGAEVPLAAHALQLRAPAAVVAQRGDGTVQLPAPIEPGFRYAATVMTSPTTVRPVAVGGSEDRSAYLQFPPDLDPRIAALARDVTAAAGDAFARAHALESHLRSQYAYSFDTVFTSQGDTPLAEFLFGSRRGHCEFFAASLAVMLRALGIPARVVNGYLAHNYNPVTGLYEVRAFDGHAWVEAWIDGTGWVTFEPTPAYPVPQAVRPNQEVLQQLAHYAQQLARQSALEGRPTLAQTAAAVLQSLAELWHLALFALGSLAHALLSWIDRHAFGIAATLLALAGALWIGHRLRPQLVWLIARTAVRATPSPRRPLAALRWVERLARARGRGRAAHESIDEYLRRIEADWREAKGALRALGTLFDRARYGEHRPTKADTAAAQRAFVRIGRQIVAAPAHRGAREG